MARTESFYLSILFISAADCGKKRGLKNWTEIVHQKGTQYEKSSNQGLRIGHQKRTQYHSPVITASTLDKRRRAGK